MNYRIGSIVVTIKNPEAMPKYLKNLLKNPTTDTAEYGIFWQKHSEVSWELNEENVIREDNAIGRSSHQMSYDYDNKTIIIDYIDLRTKRAVYWFQRDLFGIFGSLSGSPTLHSSSVVYNDQGYIFCAYSGTGKSTIMQQLSKVATPINDEANWIIEDSDGKWKLVNQRYYFYPEETREFLDIAGIYALAQASKCKILDEISASEALPLLLAIFMPFSKSDPNLKIRAINCERFRNSIGMNKLDFSLDCEDTIATLFNNR